jgi:hypothetical protein
MRMSRIFPDCLPQGRRGLENSPRVDLARRRSRCAAVATLQSVSLRSAQRLGASNFRTRPVWCSVKNHTTTA